MKTIHIDWYLNKYELLEFLRNHGIRTSYERLSDLLKDGLFPQPRLRIIGAPKVRMCKLWLEETIRKWIDCYQSLWEIPDAKGTLIRTPQAMAIKDEFDHLFANKTERVHFESLPWKAAEIVNTNGPLKVEIVDVVEPEPEVKPEPQKEAQTPSENAIPFDNPALASVFISPVLNDQLVQLRISIEARCGELKGSLEAVLNRLRTIEAKLDTLALDFKHPQQKDELTVDNILEDLEKNP